MEAQPPSDTMREYPESTGVPSDEGSCPPPEEERDPDYTEERFRVDRRKLEHMIQAVGGRAQNAEDFFIQIMDVTNTQITWPSKLKIGAKSKKDPHIKVSGHKDAVAEAKEKIMAVLDTKSTRVTLKMDVSHTEHSHVIGKGGNNIKSVMQDTGCHIHFPDSNRNNQSEKSNQVSIAGQPQGVEKAREKIRDLLPLVYMFELQMTGPQIPDASSPGVQRLQTQYGVTITFKQRPRMYVTMVIIRGSVNNAKSVKEATLLMVEQLTGSVGAQVPVSMQLEIAPQHHLFIIGRGGANIKQIMQQTGATIHFPDPGTAAPQRKGTVYITGSLDSVFLARNHLIGCLPLVLMFDMKEDVEVDQVNLSQLMEQLDVFISIKPKPKQPSKSVIVKSIERNAANLYEARRRLLGVDEEPVIVNNTTGCFTTSLGLQDLSLLGQNLVNLNSSPLLMLNKLHSTSPGTSPTALISTSSVYGSPLVVLSPHSYTHALQSQLQSQLLQQNQNGLNGDLLQQHALLQLAASDKVTNGNHGNTSGSDSPHGSPASCTSPPAVPARLATRGATSPTRTLRHAPPTVTSHQHMTSQQIMTSQRMSSPPGLSSQHITSSQGMASQPMASLQTMTSQRLTSPEEMTSRYVMSQKCETSLSGSMTELLGSSLGSGLEGLLGREEGGRLAVHRGSLPPHPGDILPPGEGRDGREGDGRRSSLSGLTLPPGLGLITPAPQEDIAAALQATLSGSHGNHGNSHGNGTLGMLGQLGSPSRQVAPGEPKTPPGFLPSDLQDQLGSFADAMFPRRGLSPSSSTDLFPRRDSPLGSPLPASPALPHRALRMDDTRNMQHFQNGSDARSAESDSDGSDHNRAPGSNRPPKVGLPSFFLPGATLPGGAIPETYMSAYDYEQKKLMATKAMQKKPQGETRLPTDYWSGLGFSKSMPDSAIRDRLKQNNVRYNGPSMTTTYEESGEELQSPVSRDFPSAGRDSPVTPPPLHPPPLHPASIPRDRLHPASPTGYPSHHTHRKKVGEFGLVSSNHEESMSSMGMTAGGGSGSASSWPPKTDLAELFSHIGLGKYTDLFTQQEIDLATFLTLTDQDLKELGISTFGARRKMILAIQDYNKKPSLMSAAPGSNNPFRDVTGSSSLIGSRRHDIASQSGRW